MIENPQDLRKSLVERKGHLIKILTIKRKNFQEKKEVLEINFDQLPDVLVFQVLQFQVQSYHHVLKKLDLV